MPINITMNPAFKKTISEHFNCQVPYEIQTDSIIKYRGFRLVPRNDVKFPLRQVLEIIDQIEYPLRILPQPIAEEIGEYAAPILTANALRQLMECQVDIDIDSFTCKISAIKTTKRFWYGHAIIRQKSELNDEILEIMARLPHQREKIDISKLPADLVEEIEDSGWHPVLPCKYDAGNCEYATIHKDIAFYDYEGDYTILYGESYDLEYIIRGILDYWNS